MDAVVDFVKDKAEEMVGDLGMPVMGEEEDVKRAKDLVGEDVKLFAALRVPEEALKISPMYYLFFCMLPPAISAKRRLENTLYIVTDKGVKVHVDPYEPFLGIGNADNDKLDVGLADITDVKIVQKKTGCMGCCSSDKIVLEGPGVDIYVGDMEDVAEALKKVKDLASAGEDAAAAVSAVTS